MRIRIEIDGKTVLDTEVEAAPGLSTAAVSPEAQPPGELLRRARALGAQDAGTAAYVRSSGESVLSAALTGRARASVAGARSGADADAGRAVRAGGAAEEPMRPVGKRRAKTKRARRG